MKKKNGYFSVCAVIALAVFAALSTLGLAVVGKTSAERKNSLDALHSKAFYDVCDGVNNLEVNLSKLIVSRGENNDLVTLNTVGALAEGCESALAALPLSYHDVENASKYFNQVADWSRVNSAAVVNGTVSEGFGEQAEQLYIVARSLNDGLRTLASDMGERCVGDCVGENRTLVMDFSGGFSEMQTNGVEYPELIYDGPFSDAKKHGFEALSEMSEISESEAVETVKRAFGADEAYFTSVTHGKTDIYEIQGKTGNEEFFAAVTVKGGLIVQYDRAREVKSVTLSQQNAVAIAEGFMQGLGYDNALAPVWYNASGGIALVTLAPRVNGVTLYPDIVKVKIALDDGTLLGVEAAGYCASHRERVVAPSIDEQTVRALVSPRLSVQSISLAVIPSEDSSAEYFCYEVAASYKGLDYFVYLDAVTGEQRNILRVVDSDQGEVVM